MVSALVTRGYITRDSHLIRSQPWTVDLDGPATPGWAELLEGSARVLQSTIKKGPKRRQQPKGGRLMAAGGLGSTAASAVKVAGSGEVVKVDL